MNTKCLFAGVHKFNDLIMGIPFGKMQKDLFFGSREVLKFYLFSD